MDAVEIFLLFVVGFSVLVFLIIDNFDSFEKSGKSCCVDGGIKTEVEEQICVGGEGEEDGREVFVGEIPGKEERENPDTVGIVKLGFYSGHSEGEGGIGDDWEGIERTELEKMFGEAVVFVSCHSNAGKIADLKLELYGLEQVALEGPCHGSQPMALNIPARSKWNAWQKLGDISREVAMETYIEILSKATPGWQGKDKPGIQESAAAEYQTSIKHNEQYGSKGENEFF